MAQIVGGLVGNLLSRLNKPAPQPRPTQQVAGGLFAGPVQRQFSEPSFRLTGQNIPSGLPPARQVPRTNTNVTTGGQPTVQTPQPQNNPAPQPQPSNNPPQDYFEPQPVYVEPDIDISEDLRTAQALADRATTDLDAAQSRIESESLQDKNKLGEEKSRSLADIERGKETFTARTEEGVNEQRRATSEIQQGLASRYGASSSTGLGASAIIASQSLRSIGQLRTGLTQQLGELDRTEKDIEYQVLQKEKEIDESMKALKKEAQAEFQAALLQAQQLKGAAVRYKQSMVIEARQKYMRLAQEVEARNTGFKQKLALQREQQMADLEKERTRLKALSDRALTTQGVAVDKLLQSLANAGALTGPGLRELESRAGLPSGSVQTPATKQKDPLDAYLEQVLGETTYNEFDEEE